MNLFNKSNKTADLLIFWKKLREILKKKNSFQFENNKTSMTWWAIYYKPIKYCVRRSAITYSFVMLHSIKKKLNFVKGFIWLDPCNWRPTSKKDHFVLVYSFPPRWRIYYLWKCFGPPSFLKSPLLICKLAWFPKCY